MHNGSMAVSITVRNVPDATRDALAARAAASGRSLQEYLSIELQELAARPTVDAALVEIRRRAVHYPPVELDSIAADLDADRR
jgi:plasmid stability protein